MKIVDLQKWLYNWDACQYQNANYCADDSLAEKHSLNGFLLQTHTSFEELSPWSEDQQLKLNNYYTSGKMCHVCFTIICQKELKEQ